MAGNVIGGKKAAATNKKRQGADFYQRIGRKGGLVSTPTGGFGSDKVGEDGLTGRERARLVGAIGGHTSKRGKAKKEDES